MPRVTKSRPVTKPPRPSRAKLKRAEAAAAALEICEAQAARRTGEARWDAAIKRAVQAGVIPDSQANPEPVGTNRQTYADAVVTVSLFVAAPIAGLNHAAFVADLLKAEVDPRLIKRLHRKHRTQTKAAHRYTATFSRPAAV